MATYNGHKNWNYWNVSLWINNDEWLYSAARDCVRHNKTRRAAAEMFIDMLQEVGIAQTPDGAPYTNASVSAAMQDM